MVNVTKFDLTLRSTRTAAPRQPVSLGVRRISLMLNFIPLSTSCATSNQRQCLGCRFSGLRLQASAFWALCAQLALCLIRPVRIVCVWPNIWLNPDGFAAA
jgi:hypothetical protein